MQSGEVAKGTNSLGYCLFEQILNNCMHINDGTIRKSGLAINAMIVVPFNSKGRLYNLKGNLHSYQIITLNQRI